VLVRSFEAPEECVIIDNYSGSPGSSSSGTVVRTTRRGVRSVRVRVPATTSNFGSGLDCIAMALDLWLDIEVSLADTFSFEFAGIDCKHIARDDRNLICRSVHKMFMLERNDAPPPLRYRCRSTIPCDKGLGLSAASIVGGVIVGTLLSCQSPLPNYHELLQRAARCDPSRGIDSIAAALYGGVQIAIHNRAVAGTPPRTDNEPEHDHADAEGEWISRRIGDGSNDVGAVVFVPDQPKALGVARQGRPTEVSLADCQFNIGRVAFLVHALCHRDADAVRYGTQDAVHQRALADKFYPHMTPLIDAARRAGAHCCFLSGSGPSVVALTFTARDNRRHLQDSVDPVDISVAKSMLDASTHCDTNGRVLITSVVDHGAAVDQGTPHVPAPGAAAAGTPAANAPAAGTPAAGTPPDGAAASDALTPTTTADGLKDEEDVG